MVGVWLDRPKLKDRPNLGSNWDECMAVIHSMGSIPDGARGRRLFENMHEASPDHDQSLRVSAVSVVSAARVQ